MLLVPAGKIVDSVIKDLLPHLEKGDIIIDGGNSHFLDTERAKRFLAKKESNFSESAFPAAKKAHDTARALCPADDSEFYERHRADSRSRFRQSQRRTVRRVYGKFERGTFCKNGA